jgi:hypothetical protein
LWEDVAVFRPEKDRQLFVENLRRVVGRRLCPFLLGVLLVAPSCERRSLPAADALLESGPGDGVASDGVSACGGPSLGMGFVSDFTLVQEGTAETWSYKASGTVTYHGAITTPLASSSAFNKELQLKGSQGTLHLQYYLPLGFAVPVTVGGSYEITYARADHSASSTQTVGVVITTLYAGLVQPVLLAEVGRLGAVLVPGKYVTTPLKVSAVAQPGCTTKIVGVGPTVGCTEYDTYLLKFDASTGAASVVTTLKEGAWGKLQLLKEPFKLVNAASRRYGPTCGQQLYGYFAKWDWSKE